MRTKVRTSRASSRYRSRLERRKVRVKHGGLLSCLGADLPAGTSGSSDGRLRALAASWLIALAGSELRARAGLRWGRGRWLIQPLTAPVLFVCALVLLPWTA